MRQVWFNLLEQEKKEQSEKMKLLIYLCIIIVSGLFLPFLFNIGMIIGAIMAWDTITN